MRREKVEAGNSDDRLAFGGNAPADWMAWIIPKILERRRENPL